MRLAPSWIPISVPSAFDVHDGAPVLLGDVEQAHRLVEPRVVEQDVQLARVVDEGVEGGGDLRPFADVGSQRHGLERLRANLGTDQLRGVLADVQDTDDGAFARQAHREGAPYSASGAGDDDGPAGKSTHHGAPLPGMLVNSD